MQLNGAEIVIECLKEQGVDTVFGYPGGAILNVYDALYQHSNEIRHILTSHEQGAAHAADGYARATGKVGVCLATSGPGATNLGDRDRDSIYGFHPSGSDHLQCGRLFAWKEQFRRLISQGSPCRLPSTILLSRMWKNWQTRSARRFGSQEVADRGRF